MDLAIAIFCSLLVIQGLVSLAGGVRFYRSVLQTPHRPPAGILPHVTVLVPCRGLDQHLEQHLDALCAQAYPAFEVLFIVDDERDPATAVVRKVIEKHACPSRLLLAGLTTDRGQKVHNLTVGTSHLSPRTEVIVFADTDALMSGDWLANLVAPLAADNDQVGVTTGFRWYIGPGFVSALLSAWNGAAATELRNDGKNFCWGGSTAIRRALFDELHIAEGWKGTVSDDYVISHAVRRAGRLIAFVPQCLVVSREVLSLRELLRFTTRQMHFTRVYNRRYWMLALVANGGFLAGLVASAALGAQRAIAGRGFVLAGLFAVLYLLAALKGVFRTLAALGVLREYQTEILKASWMYVLGVPLVSLLYVYNCLAAWMSDTITWRGITYRLTSSTKFEITSRS